MSLFRKAIISLLWAVAFPSFIAADQVESINSTLEARAAEIYRVRYLTGPELTGKWGAGYTDLGIPVQTRDGRLLFAFGDTFRDGVLEGDWRAPVAMYSSNTDLDRVKIDAVVGGSYAVQLVYEPHHNKDTALPSDAFNVNGDLYMDLVRGPLFKVNRSDLFKSEDNGATWKYLYNWPGDMYNSAFQQKTCTTDDQQQWVYCLSTITDREKISDLLLHRVPAAQISSGQNAWQTYGYKNGKWAWGHPPTSVARPRRWGEISWRNLGNNVWVLTWLSIEPLSIRFKITNGPLDNLSVAPERELILPARDLNDKRDNYVAHPYGGYIFPGSTLERFDMAISQWYGQAYRVMQFRAKNIDKLRVAADGWNTPYAIAPAGSASPTSEIAAVSRKLNTMELFYIREDGSVQGEYWYEGKQWTKYELAPPGSASPKGGITAVSRAPTHIDIWFIGKDGSVENRYWYEGQTAWTKIQIAPKGTASTTGGIAAVSRMPGTAEVWFICANGSVLNYYWYEGAEWKIQAFAPAGTAATTSRITAVSRAKNTQEVWFVGKDGSVKDYYWYEGDIWRHFDLTPPNSASLTGGIRAVSRKNNTLELWYIGQDGSVMDYYWYEEAKYWGKLQLAPPGTVGLSSGIGAVSWIQNGMQVWVVGKDGAVKGFWWYEGDFWKTFDLTPPNSASRSGGLAVISRAPNTIEAWYVGQDGSVMDAYTYF